MSDRLNKRTAIDAAWLKRDFIYESGAIISSLGVSLSEAAWRGADLTTEATLRQLIAVVKATATTTRDLIDLSLSSEVE